MELRAMLEDLAERLHRRSTAGDERAAALEGDVQQAIADEDHEGLGNRLTEGAVEFEDDHPELADFLRRLADHLAAGGI